MKTSLKKIVALSTAVGLVAMHAAYFTVNAAGATIAIKNAAGAAMTNTNINAATPTEIRIQYTTSAAFSTGDKIRITIKDSAGSLVGSAPTQATVDDTQAVNAADGSFVYSTATALYTFGGGAAAGTGVDLGFTTPSLAAGVYTITVSEDRIPASAGAEVFGATQLNVGNANQVVVSATVEPILAMSVSTGAVDLGVLSPTAVATTTNTVGVLTNAQGGYSVSVLTDDGAGGAGLRDTLGHTIPAVAASGAVVAGASQFGLYVSNAGGTTVDPGFNGDGTADIAVSNSAQTLFGFGTPTALQTATVTYVGAVSATQAAGNYSTTVTYSVTGNF